MNDYICELCGSTSLVEIDDKTLECQNCGLKISIDSIKKDSSSSLEGTSSKSEYIEDNSPNSESDQSTENISLEEVGDISKDISGDYVDEITLTEDLPNTSSVIEFNTEHASDEERTDSDKSSKVLPIVIALLILVAIAIVIFVVIVVVKNYGDKSRNGNLQKGNDYIEYTVNSNNENTTQIVKPSIPRINCYTYYIGGDFDTLKASYNSNEIGVFDYTNRPVLYLFSDDIFLKKGQKNYWAANVNESYFVENGIITGMIKRMSVGVDKEIQDAFITDSFYSTKPLILEGKAHYLIWEINDAYYILATYVLLDDNHGSWYASPLDSIIVLKDISQFRPYADYGKQKTTRVFTPSINDSEQTTSIDDWLREYMKEQNGASVSDDYTTENIVSATNSNRNNSDNPNQGNNTNSVFNDSETTTRKSFAYIRTSGEGVKMFESIVSNDTYNKYKLLKTIPPNTRFNLGESSEIIIDGQQGYTQDLYGRFFTYCMVKLPDNVSAINILNHVPYANAPNDDIEIIGTIPDGAVFDMKKPKSYYTQITYNGVTGEIATEYLVEMYYIQSGSTPIKIYNEPIPSYGFVDIICNIPNGSKVDIVESRYDWTRITYNGQTGWVPTKYLD